ncbi:MAG: hypothetical protein DME26_02220 [Verrucomicrobia bacterium]|nr:MAG: hypothetical protein DME26_02220 [Verrucomicrobiota bacterium]
MLNSCSFESCGYFTYYAAHVGPDAWKGGARKNFETSKARPRSYIQLVMNSPDSSRELQSYPLLTALRERRSRRFGLGMIIPGGPLAIESRHKPAPLTEGEEAALVFAACGITGHALADLCYAKDGGGSIMAGLVARTIASGDGLQTVSLVVTNDAATYLIPKPRELAAGDIAELIELARRGEFTELYHHCRVKIKDGRANTPAEPLFNINANRWSAHAPGTSYFLPVNDLTLMYVNGLLEILNEHTGAFILDERNNFLPAGLAKFARRRGGHLEDDPHKGRVTTLRQVEQFVTEFVTAEQGRVCVVSGPGLSHGRDAGESLRRRGLAAFARHETPEAQSEDSVSRRPGARRGSVVETVLPAFL